jgi:hypothetical protein
MFNTLCHAPAVIQFTFFTDTVRSCADVASDCSRTLKLSWSGVGSLKNSSLAGRFHLKDWFSVSVYCLLGEFTFKYPSFLPYALYGNCWWLGQWHHALRRVWFVSTSSRGPGVRTPVCVDRNFEERGRAWGRPRIVREGLRRNWWWSQNPSGIAKCPRRELAVGLPCRNIRVCVAAKDVR